MSLSFFRFRPRPTTNYLHNIWNPPVFFHPYSDEAEEGPDLSQFIRYSLLGPLCFASVFKFCLHDPSTLISQQSCTANFYGLVKLSYADSVVENSGQPQFSVYFRFQTAESKTVAVKVSFAQFRCSGLRTKLFICSCSGL